jgi:hypothetical protein
VLRSPLFLKTVPEQYFRRVGELERKSFVSGDIENSIMAMLIAATPMEPSV